MRLGTILLLAAAMTAVGCNDRNDPDDSGTPLPDGATVENTVDLCSNGEDDDADGLEYCNDDSCCSVVTCDPSTRCGRMPDGGVDDNPSRSDFEESA